MSGLEFISRIAIRNPASLLCPPRTAAPVILNDGNKPPILTSFGGAADTTHIKIKRKRTLILQKIIHLKVSYLVVKSNPQIEEKRKVSSFVL
jgi:hypothetical protein